jgi:hypothetical protein
VSFSVSINHIRPYVSLLHSVSFIKNSQLILYMEITSVCSETHTKHVNTLCGQNVEFVSVSPLNAELNPICHLLALLGGATVVVVSRLRVKLVVHTV